MSKRLNDVDGSTVGEIIPMRGDRETVIDAQEGSGSAAKRITVPHRTLLLDARYARDGEDLTLTARRGPDFVVRGYFATCEPGPLETACGVRLAPELVTLLAGGPFEPGRLLRPIARITRAQGTVTFSRCAAERVAAPDTVLCAGDLIEAADRSSVVLEFVDGTVLEVGPRARLALEAYEFDHEAQRGRYALVVLRGTFSAMAGAIAAGDPGAAQIRTPLATLTARGHGTLLAATTDGHEDRVHLLGGDGRVVVGTDAGFVVLTRPNQITIVSDPSLEPPDPIPCTAFEPARAGFASR